MCIGVFVFHPALQLLLCAFTVSCQTMSQDDTHTCMLTHTQTHLQHVSMISFILRHTCSAHLYGLWRLSVFFFLLCSSLCSSDKKSNERFELKNRYKLMFRSMMISESGLLTHKGFLLVFLCRTNILSGTCFLFHFSDSLYQNSVVASRAQHTAA